MLQKPANWRRLIPEQKRSLRMEAWVSGEAISFENPEAKSKYQERAALFKDAIELKTAPTRVPVVVLPAAFALRRVGIDQKATMYDRWEDAGNSFVEFLNDFEPDCSPLIFFRSGPSMELLGQTNMKWAGCGLPDDVQYQFLEQEYMKIDEYDHFINDPTDFILRVYWPRLNPALKGLKNLPRFSLRNIERGIAQLSFLDPELQKALDLLRQSASLSIPMQEVSMHFRAQFQVMGYPSFGGSFLTAPYDVLGDMLRGTRGIMTDLFRKPQKVISACEKIAVLTEIPDIPLGESPLVVMPLHKGSEGFMSKEQYEKFYWPTFKQVMIDLIKEGLIPVPFAEGIFNDRLEFITELPHASTVWYFEQSDMHLVKDVLGDRCCIMGNVPISLMATGTAGQVNACCQDLIDYCGRGGGFILAPSTQIDDGREETIRALIDFPKSYMGKS